MTASVPPEPVTENADPATPDSGSAPITADGPPPTRWEITVTGERHQFYTERFDRLWAEGADLDGEARFVDALVERGAAVLDAGCGVGRVAAALHQRGHAVIGVDKDRALIDMAVRQYPETSFLAADLLELSRPVLAAHGAPEDFDLIVVPGNVMVYLAPGTERQVLGLLAGLLRPGGRVVTGFATDREYSIDQLDADAEAVGLVRQHRFATWQLRPFTLDSAWAVTVLGLATGPETAGEPAVDTSLPPSESWPASTDR